MLYFLEVKILNCEIQISFSGFYVTSQLVIAYLEDLLIKMPKSNNFLTATEAKIQESSHWENNLWGFYSNNMY